MLRPLKSLTSLTGPQGLRAQLLRSGIGGGIVKTAGTLLGFAVTAVLARALGTEDFGVYAYVQALVMLMVVPAQLGLPTLVVRETARFHVHEDWPHMMGLWRSAASTVLVTAIVTVAIAGSVAWAASARFTEAQAATFRVGLLLVPLIALGSLRGAALRGLRRVVASDVPELIARPGILAALAVVALLAGYRLTPVSAIALHVAAAAAAFILGSMMLRSACPRPLLAVRRASYRTRAWIRAAIPLGALTAIQLVNQHAALILLGAFRSAEEVGVYRVASQVAMFVVFGLQVVNAVAAPHIAALHAAGDAARLQRLVTNCARASLLFAAPVALGSIWLGDDVLALVVGPEFATGWSAMAILCVAQTANAATGSVGFLLTMTGHVRETVRGIGAGMAANVILSAALIPFLGLVGAAVATALSIAVWNGLLWWSALRRLGIDSGAVPIRRLSGATGA